MPKMELFDCIFTGCYTCAAQISKPHVLKRHACAAHPLQSGILEEKINMPKKVSVNISTVLRNSGFFGTVSDDLLSRITRIARIEYYEKGDLIFAEGVPCTGMYVVAAGAVKIYKIGMDGREHVLHVAEPGDTFGEVALFLGNKVYPAYAAAVKNSTVVFIPKRSLLELLEKEPELSLQVLGSLATWTHKLVDKLEILTLKDASSRLAGYIIKRAVTSGRGVREFQLAVPKSTLAAELAISSETLSRLLTRFEAQGLIASEGRHIRILDMDGLKDVSDWGAGEG